MMKERFILMMLAEHDRAIEKFNKFSTFHEGYAIIKEELDELWDEIKGKQRKREMRDEAIQVATMAMRFAIDLI